MVVNLNIDIQAIVFVVVLVLFSIAILRINVGRNAWDVLFFNSTLAILGLFMLGILAKDADVWKIVASGLVVVATGQGIIGYFIKKTG